MNNLRVFTIFRTPIGMKSRVVAAFEGFLEARTYAYEHPDLIEDEIEAACQAEAVRYVQEDIRELSGTYNGFLAPWSDDHATPALEAGFT